MTNLQYAGLEASVQSIGYFKTSNLIRAMYNDGTITLRTAKVIFRTLRDMQAMDLNTISFFLFRI